MGCSLRPSGGPPQITTAMHQPGNETDVGISTSVSTLTFANLMHLSVAGAITRSIVGAVCVEMRVADARGCFTCTDQTAGTFQLERTETSLHEHTHRSGTTFAAGSDNPD